METELKFALRHPDLAALQRRLRASAGHRCATTTQLASVYFDTPHLRLKKTDPTVRVRKAGRRYVQAVKSERRSATLASRGEWQDVVRGPEPDLTATATAPPLTQALGADAFLRRVKTIQDDLGHLNDVRSAERLLAALRDRGDAATVDRAGGMILGWHNCGLAEGGKTRLRKHVRRFRAAAKFW